MKLENLEEKRTISENEQENYSDDKILEVNEGDSRISLSGMYKEWFMDYASYVITDRAVPHIHDGLKPVQRRILYTMKRLDDGRYNKVANIVGDTMKLHPHGDTSIGAALVQLGQKKILIDCQGNWGNILTGDGAAAPRYIEARLSELAIAIAFNAKTTEWKLSYDGRNKEPITLPLKFPLLLVQGGEGIAVGLQSKILPHNFNELIEASIAHLKGQEFILYPDFQTGGCMDVTKYNDGERGGSVKVRAKINKIDNKTLVITEIPFGKTTSTLVETILKANENGKIKIRKVEDITAKNVEIVIHLASGVSPDKAIDALYAFTDCEISISLNCCVIDEKNKPKFMTVSTILKHAVDRTLHFLKLELEIEKDELLENLHFAFIEKIFIEEGIYKESEFENATELDYALGVIDKHIELFKDRLIRPVTRQDLLRLMEIRMERILKFNKDRALERIASCRRRIEIVCQHIQHIVEYTVDWFVELKEKFGKDHPRKTEIRSFDKIEAAKVVEATEKLYVNRKEGFIGYGLKKDEFVCNCSDMEDIIIFFKNGKYKVVKISEKMFVGKDILYLNVFKRNDHRTIYNVVYRNGKCGSNYMKRFAVTGISRDKEYDLTQTKPESQILYFSANPNGETEVIKVILKSKLRQKVLVFDKKFSEIAIKGRNTAGNILTKADIDKIFIKARGISTFSGCRVWFDRDILRLNYEGRGEYLGEFFPNDLILAIEENGRFYMTNFDPVNHYQGKLRIIEKFNPNKVWTAALYDQDQQGFPYLKRFFFEKTMHPQCFLGKNPTSKLILLTDTPSPSIQITFGGNDSFRESLILLAESFVGIKSFRAKGKRITTFEITTIREIESLPPVQAEAVRENILIKRPVFSEEKTSLSELLDEITGQRRLF